MSKHTPICPQCHCLSVTPKPKTWEHERHECHKCGFEGTTVYAEDLSYWGVRNEKSQIDPCLAQCENCKNDGR